MEASKEDLRTLDELRGAIAKITADRETFNNLVEAYGKENVESYESILKKFDFPPPICRLVCDFVCWVIRIVKCERICRVVCPY